MPVEITNEFEQIQFCHPEFAAESGQFWRLLRLVLRKKRLIGTSAVAGGVVAAIAALLSPVRFTATTLILPPQQQQSAAAALLGQLGSLASLGDHDLGLKNPADLYIGMVKSRTVADHIVEKFGLRKIYKTPTETAARAALAANSSFETGKDTMIKISVQDGSPKRAADIANAYVDELYQQTSRLAVTESGHRRMFFEQRLAEERKALAEAELSLKKLQQRTGIIQVSGQVEASIRSIAQLKAEIAGRSVLLQRLGNSATDQNPEVIQTKSELSALNAELRKLEAGSSGGDPLIGVTKVPEDGLEYVRSMRDVKYHETLVELLAKQFEAAKIDEARESSVIQVVDAAVPPDTKSWPPRAALTLSGLFFGTLIGFCIAYWEPTLHLSKR